MTLKQKFDKLLFKTFIYTAVLLVITLIWSFTIHKSADYIYNTYSAPFLQSGSFTVTPHNQKLTTKPLQIEYTVLKVPTAKPTAAKK